MCLLYYFFIFVFFHSHAISAVAGWFCFHSATCPFYPCLSFMKRRLQAFFLGWLCLLLFLSRLMDSLGRTSCHTSPWGFYPFLSSFLEPLWPISFHFTFLLPLIMPVALLTHWALPISLSSHSPFSSLSPLVAFVGLLAHWTLFSSFFFL